MAISSTSRKAGPFTGNGTTTEFSFDFKVFDPTDVAVVQACPLGAEVTLALGSAYDIALNEDQNEAPGGVVTLREPLGDGCRLVLLSVVPDLQPVDITNQGGFYPELLNDGLDRSTIQVQQVQERLSRAITVPVTADVADLSLPAPAAGQIIGWADGRLVNYGTDELVSVVTYGATLVDKFDGDGSQTSFGLTASPGAQNNLRISIDGVVQVPGEDFTWAGGTTLSFVAAPPDGTRIVVQYQEALADITGAVEAGAAAGASSGDAAGTAAGTAAAEVVVAGKADVNFGNVLATTLQNFPLAADVVGAIAGPLGSLLGLSVAPELFGVVSGTVSDTVATNNVTRLKAALASGYAVNGGGRTFAVFGEFRPTTGHTLKSITLAQQSSSTALEKTYLVDAVATGQITLEDVTIDERSLLKSGGMGQCSAIQLSNMNIPITLRNVTVKNGGGITGVKCVSLTNVTVDGYSCFDFTVPYASQPTDDVCQAIEFQLCTNPVIRNSRPVQNMRATWPAMPTPARQYSRGIVFGQCTGGLIANNQIGPDIEQLIDISGASNRNISITGNKLFDGGTWGIKCANFFRNIKISDNLIVRPGAAGVVLSAPGTNVGEMPGSVEITNNTIINPGSSGLWPAGSDTFGPTGPRGIAIHGRDVALPGYPNDVNIHGNRILDEQSTRTMVTGIECLQVNTAGANSAFTYAANIEPNREWNNRITRWTAGGNRVKGIAYDRCSLIGAGTLTINNSAWTAIPFTAVDLDDTIAMHDPASNPSFIIVREAGVYSVRAFLPWDNVAGGLRGLRFLVDGGSAFGQVRTPSLGAANNTEQATNALLRMNAGQRVEVQVFQNSGAAVNQGLSDCTFDLALVQRGL